MQNNRAQSMVALASTFALTIGCGSGTTENAGGSGGGGGGHGGSGGMGTTTVADGGGGGDGGSGPGMPGTIEVSADGITGSENLIFLSGVTADVFTSFVCVPIDADPFAHTDKLHPVTGGDPCTLGTDARVFDPGTYTVLFATIMGGQMVPERCIAVEATVDGDITLQAPPFAEWKSPPFDQTEPACLGQ